MSAIGEKPALSIRCTDTPGAVVDGNWARDRRLNGDETAVVTAAVPTPLRMRVLCYAWVQNR